MCVVDVRGMMRELTPEEFDEWLAYRQIIPDPMDRLIEVCKRGFIYLAGTWGATLEPGDLDPKAPEEPEATSTEISSRISMALGPGKTHGNRVR